MQLLVEIFLGANTNTHSNVVPAHSGNSIPIDVLLEGCLRVLHRFPVEIELINDISKDLRTYQELKKS